MAFFLQLKQSVSIMRFGVDCFICLNISLIVVWVLNSFAIIKPNQLTIKFFFNSFLFFYFIASISTAKIFYINFYSKFIILELNTTEFICFHLQIGSLFLTAMIALWPYLYITWHRTFTIIDSFFKVIVYFNTFFTEAE